MTPNHCPNCKVDLAAPGGGSRVVGIQYPRTDRVGAWRCPDCRHTWAGSEPPMPGAFRTFNVEVIR